MEQFFNDFINRLQLAFSTPTKIVCSVIDILVTFALVYAIISFLRRNNALRILKYIFILVVLVFVINSLNESGILGTDFQILGKISENFILIMVLLVVVLYSDDLKRVFRKLYSRKEDTRNYNVNYNCSDEELRIAISEIVKAVQSMSKKNIGALLIIAPDHMPDAIIESGTKLDAELSSQLIECVFFNKSPLHDGAVFIRGKKLIAAGCFLPLSQKTDLDKDLGTRHRAAIGETEQYNNHLAIIVSEETGIISVAKNGDIVRYYDSAMLYDVLEQAYGLKASVKIKKRWN